MAQAIHSNDASVTTRSDMTKDIADTLKEVTKEKVYDICEQMPSFPGGTNALNAYLAKNVVYPEDAQKKGIQGRVLVKFVVRKDGSISNAQVAKNVDPTLDQEALRVVMGMPKWKPGRNNGELVSCRYVLPLVFRLH